jgi:hypothetical protein
VLLLPAIRIKRLPVIAFLIQQSDGNQREIRIARRFQVIAG